MPSRVIHVQEVQEHGWSSQSYHMKLLSEEYVKDYTEAHPAHLQRNY